MLIGFSALASHGVNDSIISKAEPALPVEIAGAEADYDARQQIIEEGLSSSRFECRSIGPEVRRRAMVRWMDSHREELSRQQAFSNAIDQMFRDQGLEEISNMERQLPLTAPNGLMEEASAEGKRWLLHAGAVRLRERLAHDPEEARRGLRGWIAERGTSLAEGERKSPRVRRDKSLSPALAGIKPRITLGIPTGHRKRSAAVVFSQ